MQAGVSNQVDRVLEIYELKRTGVLLEIDEKPELPNNVIVPNVRSVFLIIVRLTYPYADTWLKWLAQQIFSLKRDLSYKKVTKVADFQCEKARTSTRSTKSICCTTPIKTWKTSATLNSFVRFFFWRRFADHSSNLALGVLLKFPNMSRHSGRWCGSMILLLVFLFTFSFTATHFHPAGR